MRTHPRACVPTRTRALGGRNESMSSDGGPVTRRTFSNIHAVTNGWQPNFQVPEMNTTKRILWRIVAAPLFVLCLIGVALIAISNDPLQAIEERIRELKGKA